MSTDQIFGVKAIYSINMLENIATMHFSIFRISRQVFERRQKANQNIITTFCKFSTVCMHVCVCEYVCVWRGLHVGLYVPSCLCQCMCLHAYCVRLENYDFSVVSRCQTVKRDSEPAKACWLRWKNKYSSKAPIYNKVGLTIKNKLN